MKKIIITDKSINALRIISYLKNRRIELKKLLDLKVDKMYETTHKDNNNK